MLMIATSTLPAVTAKPVTFAALCTVLQRRRSALIWPLALLLVAAGISCLLATQRYRATSEIQVQKETGGSFGLDNSLPGGADTPSDSLDYAMTLQTEVGILASPALAYAVIEAEHLENTPDYFQPPASTHSFFSLPAWLTLKSHLEPLNVPLAEAPNRRYAAAKIFKAHLKVTPLPGTRLIDVSYTDRDPVRAAAVTNTITRVLADMAFQQKFTATHEGSAWLSGQLDELRTRTEQAEAKADMLQRGTGMFGRDASRNVVLERLDSLNQVLMAAESNRILKEAIDKVASEGSPEFISSLSGNSSTGSVASINTSLSLLQGLRQQEAQVRAELSERSARYGPANPKIAELRAQLADLGTSVAAETARLGQRAHTDWEIAHRQEASARAAFEQQKQLASRQNDSVLAYELAKQEADSGRELYEGLLAKLKQTSLLEGLRANNVSVVSPAVVPSLEHPSSPNILLRLGGAAALGLFLGGASIAFAELRDTSIQSLADVELLLGSPLLAILPLVQEPSRLLRRRKQDLLDHATAKEQAGSAPGGPLCLPLLDARQSTFSEGLRSLRTTLQLSRLGGSSKVILITSCLEAEGKTTLALNLAASFAQAGARVLLVDADMRRPTLHRHGAAPVHAGLATALSGHDAVPAHTISAALPTLNLLSGAELPPFPSELLGSPRMAQLLQDWRASYDYILLDSPPVLPVTDAVLLSQYSDVTLLVARHQQTTKQALRRGVEALQRQSAVPVPIGVVLNGVARSSGEFYEYFGHKGELHASHRT